ncbi:SPOR domain-containing protein [Sphingobium aquiterrae]|uniref:SPOR domain-containing protein n=1 Tax=Sphingobium aquiterrae TaxID=2038656 RepID=UPI0030163492
MKHICSGWTLALGVAVAAMSVPALADVKAGVDAWAQGDYVKAVTEWRPLATAGDPDAQFNMGQAYKLGRGVPAIDVNVALDWYRKAAAQGHLRAQDNYGLLLFQQSKRAEALPYIQKSAARGEPRAQYLLGTALFNGDIIAKDWPRAYALMTRASASGLSQAADSLKQMDNFIPADQRQKGLTLAADMERSEKTALLAATQPVPNPAAGAPVVRETPRPVKAAPPPPSEVARPPVKTATAAPTPPAKPAPRPAATPVPAKPATATTPARAPAPAPARTGNWRVQLGAFSDDARAKTLWSSLKGKVSGLSGYQSYLEKAGNVTRLQAGPIASQADAEKLCRAIKASGADCIPKKI